MLSGLVPRAAPKRLVGLLAVMLAAGCGSVPRPVASRQERAAPAQMKSNILFRDYVGSAACRECHRQIYEAWSRSAMHQMTRTAAAASIGAPFAGEVFGFMSDRATLFREGGQRYMRVESRQFENRLFAVTKVIGGHYREDFVGIQVDRTGPGAQAFGDERVLPVSYLKFDRSYRYKGYSVFSPERPGLKRGPTWRQTCIFCHNTPAYFSTLFDELSGTDTRSYQGAQSIELPKRKWFDFKVSDPEQLGEAVVEELGRLGYENPLPDSIEDQLATSIETTRRRYGEAHLVELGIGCEACHGGCREHVQDPIVLPTFALKSPFMSVVRPDGASPTAAQNLNRVCAKCHTVLFSRYPRTWEGHSRRHHPGGSSMNSGEARNFLLGHCSEQMSCATCHDPHSTDQKSRLIALGSIQGNHVCTGCHRAFERAKPLVAHTHHPPQSTGSACIGCHMPKKNVSLEYRLTRYHRIGSPTDAERVQGDRPLECALCHADKSVLELVSVMERWYDKSYDRRALKQLYGPDLTKNAVLQTLEYGYPHEQVVAIALLGDPDVLPSGSGPATGEDSIIPLLIAELGHELPLVRFFARTAIERRSGRELGVDIHLPGPELVQVARHEFVPARPAEPAR